MGGKRGRLMASARTECRDGQLTRGGQLYASQKSGLGLQHCRVDSSNVAVIFGAELAQCWVPVLRIERHRTTDHGIRNRRTLNDICLFRITVIEVSVCRPTFGVLTITQNDLYLCKTI